jgi:hypothetical protein
MATLNDNTATQLDNGFADADLQSLLDGYRFIVCQTPEEIAQALDVRDRVYNANGGGYGVPVPDQYDHRSWLLLAIDLATGLPCGSMRLTPRSAGTIEAEEYFGLPLPLQTNRTVEISRFAILPEYRKGKTFIPTVSFGLFHLCKQLLDVVGAQHALLCAKPERVWTFEWTGYRRSGLSATYGKLGNAEHELMTCDLRKSEEIMEGHPFAAIFVGSALPQVEVPSQAPPLVGAAPARSVRRLAVGA